MVYTVEIDDRSKTAKNILTLLKDLSKTTKGIRLIETVEDYELLEKMKASLKSGRVSKRAVTKTLNDILGK